MIFLKLHIFCRICKNYAKNDIKIWRFMVFNKCFMKYICEICKYNTSRKSSYTSHLKSNKHMWEIANLKLLANMTPFCSKNDKNVFLCVYCNTEYKYKRNLVRHQNSCCHKNKLQYELADVKKNYQELKKDNERLRKKYDTLIEKYDTKRDELDNKRDELDTKRDELEATLIGYTKSKNPNVFSFVEGNYLDTKPLEEMLEVDVPKLSLMKNILEKKNGKMEMCNVLQHHSLHKTLKNFVGDLLRSIYQKDDKSTQQFFVTDCSRLSYIIRDIVNKEIVWRRDNKCVILAERIVNPILQYIRDHLNSHIDKYLEYVLEEFPHDKLESVHRIQRVTFIIIDIDNGVLEQNILKYIAPYFKLDKSIIDNKLKMLKKRRTRKRINVKT